MQTSKGSNEVLRLGNIKIKRDWGWSPEYVEAMWRILLQDKAEDFVIATGETHLLQDFVEQTFNYFNLDWQNVVEIDSRLLRPIYIMISGGEPIKALEKLDWQANDKI